MSSPRVTIEIPEHLSKPVGTPGPRLLEIERSKASFSSEELKTYLHGNAHLERIQRILPILQNEVSKPFYFDPVASADFE